MKRQRKRILALLTAALMLAGGIAADVGPRQAYAAEQQEADVAPAEETAEFAESTVSSGDNAIAGRDTSGTEYAVARVLRVLEDRTEADGQLAVEVIRGMAGSIGIICAVPASALIAAAVYGGHADF